MEIERLKRKLQKMSEAYQKKAAELEALKNENMKRNRRKRGRPVIDEKKRVQILSLCQMGNTMREIAGKTEVALSTVHKVIAEASKESRAVYVYMNRKEPATIIDTIELTGKVRIENITDKTGVPDVLYFSNYPQAFTELSAAGSNMFAMI